MSGFRMPHKCHGNGGNCPSRSHPTIWELPINELDRRDDPDFDENLTGCHLVSSCSNIYQKEQFRRLLQHNFDRHYNSNKVYSRDRSFISLCKSETSGAPLLVILGKLARDQQGFPRRPRGVDGSHPLVLHRHLLCHRAAGK